jgi:MHS family citrate/tricarballylate:H+ symporter-like MFS transporter
MLSAAERRAKINAIFRVASCNFLEAYDFIVFAYYANYIGQTFFPNENPYLEILQTLMVFGAGYVMRPLGAILLGAYMDKHGRRKGLLLTLGLMAIGTLTIAITPSYAAIGWLAPAIVILGRLLQGLSAGAEFGGVAVYLAEISTPGRRGFYCSWQGVSQQAAVIASALIGVILTALVTPADMTLWGWRVPLLIGVIAIPFLFWLRRSLPETEVFVKSRHVRSIGEVLRILAANWALIVNGMALSVMTTTSFYLITAYTPTYGRQVLQMSTQDSLLVTLFVGVSNLLWLPVGGILTDRFGARPVMLSVTAAALATAYLAMSWLVIEPDFTKLLAVLMLFSVYFGLYNGALIPTLASIMPQEVRATAFSLAFVTATAVFGGFTPAVATFLVEATGDRAAPALWLSLAATISLTAAFVLPFVQSASQREARAGAVAG